MKTRREAIDACMEYGAVYEDYPFGDSDWAVMRHIGNRKSFAYVFVRNGYVWINVKAEPMWGEFWRGAFASVVEAYHMNKRHWISIILDGTVPDENIKRMIYDSYELTRPKIKNERNY